MKTFKTLHEIKELESQQVNIQDLLNGRMYIKGKGWSDIQLSSELKQDICGKVAKLLGGINVTKNKVFHNLMTERKQHWGLSRMFIETPERITYCAGQDYPYEMNQIRTALKN